MGLCGSAGAGCRDDQREVGAWGGSASGSVGVGEET